MAVPPFLDPPFWNHQQSNNHGSGGVGDGSSDNPNLPPLQPPTQLVGGGGGGEGGERLGKLPLSEPNLKCPRCDSTNTKFCYFNNYSLCQPRHFCKTCRRYWTRGGGLKKGLVIGGNRRSKRIANAKARNLQANQNLINPSVDLEEET